MNALGGWRRSAVSFIIITPARAGAHGRAMRVSSTFGASLQPLGVVAGTRKRPPNLSNALHKRSGGEDGGLKEPRFQPAMRLLYYDLLGLICLRCCLFRNRDGQDAIFGFGLDFILFHVVRKEHRLLELGV